MNRSTHTAIREHLFGVAATGFMLAGLALITIGARNLETAPAFLTGMILGGLALTGIAGIYALGLWTARALTNLAAEGRAIRARYPHANNPRAAYTFSRQDNQQDTEQQ